MTDSHVTIYTDGGCNPNPGPGGWAAILLHDDGAEIELSGGEPETTNNRMELRAALEGLQALADSYTVDLYTDSQYLKRGVTQWLSGWQANGWRTTSKQPVKNIDLWQPLADQLERHQIDWHWTKGHAGDRWNERADELASAQIPSANLPLWDENAVHLFVAACYKGKTKTGGWGVVMRYRDHTKTFAGRQAKATPNQMHILSALEGLRRLTRPMPVHLYTVSDYLKNGATAWTKSWIANGWATRSGKPVSNQPQWQALLDAMGPHAITWHVVSKSDAPAELDQAKSLANEAAS